MNCKICNKEINLKRFNFGYKTCVELALKYTDALINSLNNQP